jgi:tetratricopeptide (TPR) repeat protein
MSESSPSAPFNLREELDVSPGVAVAICQSANELLEHDRTDEALVLYEGLVALDSSEPYYRVCLACGYMKVDRLEDAEREFREVLRVRPEDVTALAYLGEILLERKDYRLAEGLLKKAIDVGSEHNPYANRARRMLQVLASEKGKAR